MTDIPQVINDPAAAQFEIRTEQGIAKLLYKHRGPDLDLIHTEVPPPLEGHGYAAALATAALGFARREGMKVIPTCPYVKAFLQRHPEYEDLVAHR
jgi:hypothetical protein